MNTRFKLTIAYDGRPFEGWQSQPNGNAVQDHLVQAAQALCPRVGKIHGSGRTDAGVHALGQIAHLDAPEEWGMDAVAWQRALNTKLPRTIRVMGCEPAESDFHAQFSAKGKTYRYEIYRGPVLPPLRSGLAWHLRQPLDLGLLHQATSLLESEHDFAAFAANRGDPATNPASTVRTITQIRPEIHGDELSITFSGNGFLYKMVRMLMGSIIKCAEGKLTIPELSALLENPKSGKKSPLSAPADGLTLVSVHYTV